MHFVNLMMPFQIDRFQYFQYHGIMLYRTIFFMFCVYLTGCATTVLRLPDEFVYTPVHTDEFDIATWQKISDKTGPIRIYIEGDGYAFDAYGRPTNNPTPHGDAVRRMVAHDTAPNIVYMARPCQYITPDMCDVSDWTSGRFAPRIVSAMSNAVRRVAGARPIVLIGYSGGAMLSGLIITQNPDLNISQWITIAGVLNHADWTGYFGDTPLTDSVDLDELPRVPQRHYVAANDTVVPRELSTKWTGGNITVVDGTRHNDFKDFVPSGTDL